MTQINIKGSGSPLTHAQMDYNMQQLQVAIDAVAVLQTQVSGLINSSSSPATQADIDEAISTLLQSLNDAYASKTQFQLLQQEVHQTRSAMQEMVNGLITTTTSAKEAAEQTLQTLVNLRDNFSSGDPELDALALLMFNALISSIESQITNYEQQLSVLESTKAIYITNGTWYC